MPEQSHTATRESVPEAGAQSLPVKRNVLAPFTLVELDPKSVLHAGQVDSGFMAQEDISSAGKMREACPYCGDVSLRLALQGKQVIRTHLFCEKCTRCFDAIDSDGNPALSFPELLID